MAEPTLQLKRSDFAGEVGDYLGYGLGADNGDTTWTTTQQKAIYRLLDGGLRQFYYPPVLPGEKVAHEWSFLKPLATITLQSGDTSVPLPDDFGGFEAYLVITSATGSTLNVKVPLTDPVEIEKRYATTPATTGRPLFAAAEPMKGTTPSKGQRWRLRVWPQPDATYSLSSYYYLNPDALTAANPFCYGGPEHAETIKASCIAKAELERDNAKGPRWDHWTERLLASVSYDRKRKPVSLGKNIDRSDDWTDFRQRRHWDGLTTVYGTQF